ncbi:hypothetical protein Taro_001277 [Colocasia esculenta]|uniref:2-methoxy-6-polyprenyl-1,4-benzoquinol methylase, mitochondrial n=1 Tax=Colocasia esculenta TaxID=4460 RepID=A0A843TFD7_COLES|nr:hypothetical protein [Colocasia esculenta]
MLSELNRIRIRTRTRLSQVFEWGRSGFSPRLRISPGGFTARALFKSRYFSGFNAGPDPEFDALRGQILNVDHLPSLEQVYFKILKEERNKKIMASGYGSIGTRDVYESSAFVTTSSKPVNSGGGFGEDKSRGNHHCTHCGKDTHNVEHCWDLYLDKRPQKYRTNKGAPATKGDVAFRILDSINSVSRRALHDSIHEGVGETHIYVLDINPNMLNVGKKRAIERGLVEAHSLHFVEGDAEALSFGDSSMDGYTIAFGIRNVTHIEKVLKEAYRVLKKGGRFLCLELSHVDVPFFKQMSWDTGHYYLHRIFKLFDLNLHAEQVKPTNHETKALSRFVQRKVDGQLLQRGTISSCLLQLLMLIVAQGPRVVINVLFGFYHLAMLVFLRSLVAEVSAWVVRLCGLADWAQSAHRFFACERDRSMRRVRNVTALVVVFLLPLFGGLRLHGCRVSRIGQSADVDSGKATASYVAFMSRRRATSRS